MSGSRKEMSPQETLTHYGVKGMRWGFRQDRAGGVQSRNANTTMSKKKKIALGVGVGTLAVGALMATVILKKSGTSPVRLLQTATETASVIKSPAQEFLSSQKKVSGVGTQRMIADAAKYSLAQRRAAEVGKVWIANAESTAWMQRPLTDIYSPEMIARLYPNQS